MKPATTIRALLLCAGMATMGAVSPALATNDVREAIAQGSASRGLLQCVPYARRVTGITIYGDAHTWWGQAAGKYARGSLPKVGAVMNFRPHANSRLGHVAAVSRIVDSRTILIRHANWSVPGGIEDNVRAIDVSSDNDWSEVRVWYGPAEKLGTSRWPLYGFIYNEKPGATEKLSPTRKSRTFLTDPIGAIIARAR